MTHRRLKIPLALVSLACAAACRPAPKGPLRPSYDIHALVSRELLREANRGREMLGADGRFSLPTRVRRVWIDVGAHLLETTRHELAKSRDLVLIAIEPLAECWRAWPDDERLIAMPVAIDLQRGMLDFHVNADDATSSLAESREGTEYDKLTRTVEVRKVPVLRLEDVLERIPLRLDVDYLKTDVQGFDFQVLQSAGEQLRRVRRVKVEVINAAIYKGPGAARPGLEQEVVDYMRGLGFRFERDSGTRPGRPWVDKDFVNPARVSLLSRARDLLRTVPR